MPLSDVASIWCLSGGSHDEGYMQIFTRHGLAKVPKDGIGYEKLHDELLATVGQKKSPVAYDDDFGMSRVGVYLMLTGVAVGCYLMPNAAAIDTVVFYLFTFMISFAVLGSCVLFGLDNRYGIKLVPPIALGYEFMIAVLLFGLFFFFDWVTDHVWIFMKSLAAGFSLGFYVVMRYMLDPLEPPRKVSRKGQADSGKRV